MARILIDGAETDNFDLWDTSGGTTIESIDWTEMTGSYYFKFDASGESLYKILPVESNILCGSMKMKLLNTSSSFKYVFTGNNGTIGSFFVTASSNKITFLIKDGSQVEKGSYEYFTETPSEKFNFEFKLEVNSAGNFTASIYRNTTLMLSEGWTYGIDTLIKSIELVWVSAYTYLDDIVLDDEFLPGNSEIYLLKPYDNGTTNQWLSTDSTNFVSIGGIPGSNDDYIYSRVFDDIDLYKLTDIPAAGSGKTVKSVSFYTLAYQTSGPPPTERLRMIVRTDSTNFLGAIEDLATAEDPFSLIVGKTYEMSPSSREAWEEAKINDLEVGVKLVG